MDWDSVVGLVSGSVDGTFSQAGTLTRGSVTVTVKAIFDFAARTVVVDGMPVATEGYAPTLDVALTATGALGRPQHGDVWTCSGGRYTGVPFTVRKVEDSGYQRFLCELREAGEDDL